MGKITETARADIKTMDENAEVSERSEDWRIADMQRIILELKRELADEALRRHDLETRVYHIEQGFTRHRRGHAEPDLRYME